MDKYDDMAAEMLPCDCGGLRIRRTSACPVYYRPSVAAKLREMAAEIEHLRADAQEYASLAVEWNTLENQLRARLAVLEKSLICEGGACGHAIEAEDLQAKLDDANRETGEYKAAWARRGEALLKPCINCGYQTKWPLHEQAGK